MNLQEGQSLRGKRAFILGGSGDIGRAIAERLVAQGCITTIHGRSAEKVERICRELTEQHGIDENIIRTSSFTISSVESCIAEVMKHEPLDIFIMAYGPFSMATVGESTAELWQEMTERNISLPGALVSTLAPEMAKRGWGRILLFGSSTIRTVRGVVNTVAYTAAKAGIEIIARSVSRIYASEGVAVHALYPGYVNTNAGENIQHIQGRKDIRIFSPQEVADTALWQLTAPSHIISCSLQELSE